MNSKLVVESQGADGDGASIAVVAGVVHAGEPEADYHPLLELEVVVGLEDLFRGRSSTCRHRR